MKKRKISSATVRKVLNLIEKILSNKIDINELNFIILKIEAFLQEYALGKYNDILQSEEIKKHIKVIDDSALRTTLFNKDKPKEKIYRQKTIPANIRQMTDKGYFVLQKGDSQRMEEFKKQNNTRRKDG